MNYLSRKLRKNFLIAVSGLLFILSSCAKMELTHELRFSCTSNNPYLIEIDGHSDIIQGNSFKDYQLEEGTYAWKVTQQSGYLIYPTIKDGVITLDQDREIIFP
jgi:hypothetical protein